MATVERVKQASAANARDARRAMNLSQTLIAIGVVSAVVGIILLVTPMPNAPTNGVGASVEPHQSLSGNDAWFEDVAQRAGIDFVHVSGRGDAYYMPEIMTGGVCLIDYDNDGWLDIYFVQGGRVVGPRDGLPGNRLYRNLGGDGSVMRFADVTDAASVGDNGFGMGCTTGDFDNDGWTDLYVTNVGPNVLYHNNGDPAAPGFIDVTDAAGVGDGGFGSSAAFVDYDHDGDLDLFVVNYLRWSPETELDCKTADGRPDYCKPTHYNAPAPDVLYENRGDGTFVDTTKIAGMSTAFGNGLGVVCADFDGDGLVDICVANDEVANQFWRNQGPDSSPRFADEALARGVAFSGRGEPEAGMGIDAQDIDGDGDLDMVMTHFAGETNTVYRNDGGFFDDASIATGAGPSRPFTGFGSAWMDFNHDGRLDQYVANGRVVVGRGDAYKDNPYAEPNLLLAGQADGSFVEVLPRGGTDALLVDSSRGAAFGDLDNDGAIDIVVVNIDASPYVLHNVTDGGGHWITFRMLNRHGGDAIGSRVTIEGGGRRMIGDVRTAYSYCSGNDPRVHFGLGALDAINKVRVTWTDGSSSDFGPLEVDRIVQLQQGE